MSGAIYEHLTRVALAGGYTVDSSIALIGGLDLSSHEDEVRLNVILWEIDRGERARGAPPLSCLVIRGGLFDLVQIGRVHRWWSN